MTLLRMNVMKLLITGMPCKFIAHGWYVERKGIPGKLTRYTRTRLWRKQQDTREGERSVLCAIMSVLLMQYFSYYLNSSKSLMGWNLRRTEGIKKRL